jgi:multimeric flavodoxin WrbA
MRIAIINGDPEAATGFDGYVDDVASRLEQAGHTVESVTLRELDIKGCTGCWGCWVKTPGECVAHDDSELVCRAVLSADLALFASPLRMGFVTALMKRTADKLIPIVHPYIEIEGGEMHHVPRYDRYPSMGLLLGAGPDSDAEDVEITTELWSRLARNMKTTLEFAAVTDRSAEEVAHELVAAA